jgi:nucleoside-diphosphate-sugar epimerase
MRVFVVGASAALGSRLVPQLIDRGHEVIGSAPRLLARLFAGEAPVVMVTESRGASNVKAKRELGWAPRYPSWRQGFVAVYATQAASTFEPRSPVPANVAGPRSVSR